MERGNSLLEFIDLVNLDYWSVAFLKEQKNSFKNRFELIPISKILERSKNIINIEDELSYKRITIKLYSKGVVLRDEIKGTEIGVKRQYIASKGQFVMSKIDARNGAFGIIPDFLDGAIVTNDFPLFNIDTDIINPNFFFLLTSTNVFIDLAKSCSSGTTNRQRIDIDKFLNFKIPLPTLQEQQAIVDAYFSKINEANQLEIEANNIDKEIEKYLFDELGISIGNKNEKKKGLNLVEFSQLERWGVEYNLNSSNSLLSSKRFPNKRLKDILLINPTTPLPKKASLPISFIPMEVVSDDYGVVTELRSKTVSESKGYTKFMEGDLIWARITPCMQNGKSAIVKNLENGFGVGSTEFHVLRNENSNINLDYIYHFLRLDIVLKDAMSHFTGSAGQQRVPKSYLEELLIPIPEYQKQTEISNHLYQLKDLKIKLFNKVEELKQQANEAFERAIFQ